MIIAHKIALDPTQKQRVYFAKAAGCDRFVWNLALEEWNRAYAAGEKPNGAKIRKEFNQHWKHAFPWMEELHRDAHSEAFRRIQMAFNAFFADPKKTGHPTFHRKGRKESFYVANDRIAFRGFAVRLPRIGVVKMREELRYHGKIMGAVVSRQADRWFISVHVDAGVIAKDRLSHHRVGVDVGIKHSIVLSTGEILVGPKPLAAYLKRLKRRSRKTSRRLLGSRRRNKASRILSRLYARIANIRNDWIHKLTTKLCRENQAVAIEDLHVKGMLRNRRLSRSISDMGWGEFRRQLEYKSKIYGTKLIIADRFFPSSRTCSQCGHVKESLSLAERVFRCDQCGFKIDRDHNAARNLIAWGTRELTPVDSTARKAADRSRNSTG